MSTRNAILTRAHGAPSLSQDIELTNTIVEAGAKSPQAIGALVEAIQLNEEVCLSMRFPKQEGAFEDAYDKASRYVEFLRGHIPDVPPMLDADFYRERVKANFRATQEGVFASFITKLSPVKAKEMDGFTL